MKQGEKKTLLYIGITIIGLLLFIMMVAGLHNKSPKNEEKTVPDSLADETPADEQLINTPHPLPPIQKSQEVLPSKIKIGKHLPPIPPMHPTKIMCIRDKDLATLDKPV